MSQPETISEAIEQAALDGIQRVRTSDFEVQSHSLAELIEADKYNKQQDETAVALPTVGLIRRRQIPGGCG